MIRRLSGNARGAAAVEFALVAPLLIATLMSVMEAARLIWTRQVIQQTAFASARCAGLKDTGCDSVASLKTYAIARAARSGVTLTDVMVTPNFAGTACSGQSTMRKVDISLPYTGLAAPLLRRLSGNLTASACFPIITT